MKRRMGVAALAAAAVSITLVGCSGTPDSPSEESTGGGGIVELTYDGPEASAARLIEPPSDPEDGLQIGYLQIYSGVSTLVATQDAMKEAVEELGGELFIKDANLNPQNQVSQFNELISQGVDAIVVFPVDPAALAPALEAAAEAGIPVIAQNATVVASDPLPEGYATTINEALDTAAFAIAENAAHQKPGGSVVVMGTALPIPTVQYQVKQLNEWSERFGLDVLGQVDNQQDNPGGYSQAATTMAAKFPNTDFVFAYNDPYALTTAQVLASSNLTDIKVSMPIGGAAEGFDAIRAGKINASYAIPWRGIGVQSIYAAYRAVAGEKLPQVVVPEGILVTADNVDDVPAA